MRIALTICFALALAGCSPSCSPAIESGADTLQRVLSPWHFVAASEGAATVDVNSYGAAFDGKAAASIGIHKVAGARHTEEGRIEWPAGLCGALQFGYDANARKVLVYRVTGETARRQWPFALDGCEDDPGFKAAMLVEAGDRKVVWTELVTDENRRK